MGKKFPSVTSDSRSQVGKDRYIQGQKKLSSFAREEKNTVKTIKDKFGQKTGDTG